MDLTRHVRISARAAVPLLVFCLAIIDPACKDPNDFKPEDTLVPPPAAPLLLLPPDSFVRMPGAGDTSNRILLIWAPVQDADIYEIRVDGDSIPGWTVQYDTCSLNMRIDTEIGWMIDKFTWKVRAGSVWWEYYTEWSEARRFEVRYRPLPPASVFPPDDTTFVFDSLPQTVDLIWSRVQDERFYDLNILFDSMPYALMSTTDTSFAFLAETIGVYTWQVRAGSPHWEYSTWWTELRKFTVRKNDLSSSHGLFFDIPYSAR